MRKQAMNEKLNENIDKVAYDIGNIGNYYGGLRIAELDNKYYWGIENYNGTFYEEIEETLYRELQYRELQKLK